MPRCTPARDAAAAPTGGLIPLTVPEVRRLGWSRWRRAHQASAQRSHIARRARARAALPLAAAVAPPAAGALTEAEWERVRGLLPPQRPAAGRPNHDHRTVLSGILWVLRTPAPWREMPARYGKPNTAFQRYRLWRRQGVWRRIVGALGPDAPPMRQRYPSDTDDDLSL